MYRDLVAALMAC